MLPYSVLPNLLLPAARGRAPLRALAAAGVRLRPLPVRRQTAPMAQALVGPDLHQPLDVLRPLAPQVALHEQVVHHLAKLADFVLGQVLDIGVWADLGLGQDLVGGRSADAVDVGEPYLSPLVEGDVDACDACHGYLRGASSPASRSRRSTSRLTPTVTPDAACDAGSDKSRGPHRRGG